MHLQSSRCRPNIEKAQSKSSVVFKPRCSFQNFAGFRGGVVAADVAVVGPDEGSQAAVRRRGVAQPDEGVRRRDRASRCPQKRRFEIFPPVSCCHLSK